MNRIVREITPALRHSGLGVARTLRILAEPPNPRFALVCFPCAGASASFYNGWRTYWGESEVLASIQLPGREDRSAEPPAADLRVLALTIAAELQAGLRGLPMIFFGHSFGALVASETIMACQRNGWRPPIHFFPSARAGPHLVQLKQFPLTDDDAGLIAWLKVIDFEHMKLLDHPSFRRMLLPVLRADLALNDGYTLGADDRIGCAVTALVGRSDPLAAPALVAGWRSSVVGPFRHEIVDGNHFYLRSSLPALAARMRAIIHDTLEDHQSKTWEA